MACITDHYASAIEHALALGAKGFDALSVASGKPLAIVMIIVVMTPTVLLFAVLTQILVPRFFNWYFEKTTNEKAEEYWDKRCRGTGITIAGAKLSIGLGVLFFFMARFVVALPMYYGNSIPAFMAAFLSVALIGYFWGGNFPKSAIRTQYKYVRRFYAPTITGLGLGAATIALEFLLEAATLAVRYVHSI